MLVNKSVMEDIAVLAPFESVVAQLWRRLSNCARFFMELARFKAI